MEFTNLAMQVLWMGRVTPTTLVACMWIFLLLQVRAADKRGMWRLCADVNIRLSCVKVPCRMFWHLLFKAGFAMRWLVECDCGC